MPDKKRTAGGALGGLAGLVGLSAVAGVLVTATMTPAIAISGVAASSTISLFDNMDSILEIDKLMLPTEIYRFDPGTGQDVLLTQFYEQNRSPVEFDQVAPVMYDAILSSEDPRYYQHGGVDLIGTTRALLNNAQSGTTQGGSSISQQYVKNVLIQRCEKDAEETRETADDGTVTIVQTLDDAKRSCFLEATNAEGIEGYQRKLQEMRYAIQLEKQYSKNEILLGYLNIANFGGTTYSVDAAARYYFNVSAAELSVSQAAILAGIVQNPNTYRIDREGGSIFENDVAYNKAPDGLIDDVTPGTLAALDTKLNAGEITQEQYLAAADGYSATKGRQLYVLSRMLEDGKITQEQYDAAVLEPITPNIHEPTTGCASTGKAAFFCQYVVKTILNDPSFGETQADREKALRRDGLKIYTTMDARLQYAAEETMADVAPSSIANMNFGATSVSVEVGSGRVLAIAQNNNFTEDLDISSSDPSYTSLVYAGDLKFGGSIGFSAGSTFKLFTLVDWLEQGRSLNEIVNGRDRLVPNMTNSCTGNWVNSGSDRIYNFNRQSGYNGTPYQFTRQSLNTGYLGMAAELDLCDIANVATKMGVTLGNGNPITMPVANNVIGSDEVSPLAMAGAYATVASGGTYCQPKVIDRVTDNEGNDRPELVPVRNCSQVLTPEVAATAADALEGVMTSGGTGAQANPGNSPMLGKTGTHQELQSWMIESSSKVATAVWVGNSEGFTDISRTYANGRRVMDMRYAIAEEVQRVANQLYPGAAFPQPDPNLTRRVTKEVPNVVGQTIEQAQATLQEAGWEVTVGEPVDSDQPTNIVAQQDPSGSAPSGTSVTIRPSNGQATAVPSVAGTSPSQAVAILASAGFTNLTGSCSVSTDPSVPADGIVSGTNPGAATLASRSAAISVIYTARTC
jgi:membrane peptidoglycan carboxypeptidase